MSLFFEFASFGMQEVRRNKWLCTTVMVTLATCSSFEFTRSLVSQGRSPKGESYRAGIDGVYQHGTITLQRWRQSAEVFAHVTP